jgi:hypothetical protein
MLTIFKTVCTTIAQTILDIGWGESEGVMLKWEHVTTKWEDMTG